MAADPADEKQRPAHLFKPGQSGNPGGRPKGSRNKLGEAFIEDMYAQWKERGAEVIEKVIAERPQDFMKCVASLLPQQMEIKRPEEEMSDEELADALGKLDTLLALARGSEGISSQTGKGRGKAH